jgi:hypothetical protein
MRKVLTGFGLALFLTMVPAAAATAADTVAAPVAHSQVAPEPQQRDEGGGNAGLWGLLGLLGLAGLAGMRKQRERAREHLGERGMR